MTGAATDASAVARARRLLARRGGWIEAVPDGYGLRSGGDRRSRVVLVLDEAGFRLLIERPGLRRRPGGGWVARTAAPERPDIPEPGRPGLIEGSRTVMEADGRPVRRRANLGQSAVDWLAQRKTADGRPWLTAAQVAAAARLGLDVGMATRGPSLTLRWDALPRAGGGSAVRVEPGDPAMAAARRVEAALAACGIARPMVDAICIRASALQVAERDLGLRRREGKILLQTGLAALAVHYRIG
ncbi:DUF6456 domain-containing protein [Brevundimonas sp.]|uniref:DUF6456 domain-containing protein n=1 Tax=Brevundimonas sp. TaxID=1871086 RepID=UPI00272FE1A8|nr:DUF6456 domain-containing protein [Brevundimonas sp.]MDP1914167.1 DUF6456 domain-containing protein [Brevundimonas sp.]